MRLTVRVKLTMVCVALVLGGGILLATGIYLLVRDNLVDQISGVVPTRTGATGTAPGVRGAGEAVPAGVAIIRADVARTSSETVLNKLLVVSGIALLVLAVLAIAVSWWVSGRILRPVHRISATARQLSSDNLHRRIALAGPRDELTDLADTFDEMLARLQTAFDSQRRFIANASHELRTPLAIQRAAVQVGLAGEKSETVTRVSQHLLAANRRSEQLIEGLLTLARSDRGIQHREAVALHTIVTRELTVHAAPAARLGIQISHDLADCWVLGDPVLLAQLASNLISNAVHHNVHGGLLHVSTHPVRGLQVENTGPHLDVDKVPELFEPFHRGTGRTAGTSGTDEGAGLGLSIVRSIVQTHAGTVRARPRPGGGLVVHVTLPPSTSGICPA